MRIKLFRLVGKHFVFYLPSNVFYFGTSSFAIFQIDPCPRFVSFVLVLPRPGPTFGSAWRNAHPKWAFGTPLFLFLPCTRPFFLCAGWHSPNSIFAPWL